MSDALRATARTAVVVAIAGSMLGCLFGPYWKDPVSLPAPSGSTSGQKIVVSPFVQSERQTSWTYSQTIATLLESATVQDVSMEVVTALRSRGIAAEARTDVIPARLAPNELLLRGGFLATGDYSKYTMPFGFLVIGSLTVLGLWLPSPIIARTGRSFDYRVELIDPKGTLLMQSGQHRLVGYYRFNNMFRQGDKERLFRDAKQQLLDEIAKMVQAGAAQTGTPRQ